jgi:hypothetical protein
VKFYVLKRKIIKKEPHALISCSKMRCRLAKPVWGESYSHDWNTAMKFCYKAFTETYVVKHDSVFRIQRLEIRPFMPDIPSSSCFTGCEPNSAWKALGLCHNEVLSIDCTSLFVIERNLSSEAASTRLPCLLG